MLELKFACLSSSFAQLFVLNSPPQAHSDGSLGFTNLSTGQQTASKPAFGWVRVNGEKGIPTSKGDGKGQSDSPYYWNVSTGAVQWNVPTVATPRV